MYMQAWISFQVVVTQNCQSNERHKYNQKSVILKSHHKTFDSPITLHTNMIYNKINHNTASTSAMS